MKVAQWAALVESKGGVWLVGEYLGTEGARSREWSKEGRSGTIKSATVAVLVGMDAFKIEIAIDDKMDIASWKPGATKGQRVAVELKATAEKSLWRLKGHAIVVLD